MTTAVITLNAGTGGEKPIIDTLTTVDGAAAPAGSSVQIVKQAFGPANNATTVTTATPLPTAVFGNGLVSTLNSSIAVLGIGGVFTGTAEDVTEYADIRVSVFSDQISATDGLQIQQSVNGTNWDLFDPYNIPAASGKIFSIAAAAKFYRVVYTNGATAQTAFRLQTKLHKTYSKGSSVRPQDARTNDNDFEEMLAFSMGYNGTSWDRLRSTVANGLVVDVSRIIATASVAGTRNNNGTANVAGSFHLTVGGSDGTNLRPLLVDATGRLNVNSNAILTAETTKVIGTINLSAAQTLATVTTVGAVTAITNALPTGANTIGAVTGPAAAPLALDATLANHTQRLQAVTTLTTISAANTAVTLTLPAVAAQFHYITRIRISMHNTSAAAVVGSAVTLAFTSSNMPGALAWTEGNALAAGTSKVVVDEVLENAIKSSVVNTASTIVAPACGAGVLVRITAYYYSAA